MNGILILAVLALVMFGLAAWGKAEGRAKLAEQDLRDAKRKLREAEAERRIRK